MTLAFPSSAVGLAVEQDDERALDVVILCIFEAHLPLPVSQLRCRRSPSELRAQPPER